MIFSACFELGAFDALPVLPGVRVFPAEFLSVATLFLKVSAFRDFLLETDVNVLETDAFLLGNWALNTVIRGSELVAGVFELKYFCSAGTNVTGLPLGRGGHGRSCFISLWPTLAHPCPPLGAGTCRPPPGHGSAHR